MKIKHTNGTNVMASTQMQGMARASAKVGARVSRQVAARGFSLLELTLVLVILGVLMAVAAFNVLGQGEKAKVTATRATLSTIKNAINQYQLEQSAYPPDLNTLVVVKILEAGKLNDGWKRALVYDPAGPSAEQPFILFSRGPDGQAPSSDDISAWEMQQQTTGNP